MNTAVQTALERLVQSYREGSLSRRGFFQRLAFLTGSVVAAKEIMVVEGFAREYEAYDWTEVSPALAPAQAPGQAPQQPTPKESIAAGEKRLPGAARAEWVKYKSGEAEVGAYLARPKTGAPFAAIIVIHENRGLTEFVLDIAQRWAGVGLLAVAPDCLSRLGGTANFESMDAARQGIGRLVRADVVADLHASVAYLKTRDDVRKNRIGMCGFCWGGGQTWNFATESGELAFAVPFYGPPPPLERLEKISCPVFGVFAESDQFVNQNLDAVEAKLKELGKNFTRRMFPGTQHAFMNFTSPQRYNEEQAKAAWAEVTAFVKKMIG